MTRQFFRIALCLALACGSFACTPRHDWRQIHDVDKQFVVMMPAKPLTRTRTVVMDGAQVAMTMMAAEADGVTFAVGSVQLPDAAKAQAAANLLKAGLLKNINGTVKNEKSSSATVSGMSTTTVTSIELEAVGVPAGASKEAPRLLLARLLTRGDRVYQVIVLGHEKTFPRDAAQDFLRSFELN